MNLNLFEIATKELSLDSPAYTTHQKKVTVYRWSTTHLLVRYSSSIHPTLEGFGTLRGLGLKPFEG